MPEFIIWNPQGITPPSVIFDSREDAEAEARRLANKQRGEFYVCALISVSVTPDAVTTSLGAPAEAEIVSPESLLPSFEGSRSAVTNHTAVHKCRTASTRERS